jgi:glycosyltransferase involved in cell wall biosynthesis
VPKSQVPELMGQADIFCAPSLTASNGDVEGIPNTIKEAMATGIPVLATNHAGIPEIITNNKDGILVRENDVDHLAEALEFMLLNRHLWEGYAISARQNVEQNFDQNKQLLLQAKYYDELLGGS